MRPLLALVQKIRILRFRNVSTQPTTPTKRLLGLLFGKYLLVTNTVSSGLLMVAGDAFAQKIEFDRDTDGKQSDGVNLNGERIGIFTNKAYK